jgi:DNA-binding PadR family transcriptional regulator
MRTPSTIPAGVGFLILLALCVGPSSGAGIQAQIVGDTFGHYIANGTLYENLRRLIAKGFIEVIAFHGGQKVMRLTGKGEKRLAQETKLLVDLAQTARERAI